MSNRFIIFWYSILFIFYINLNSSIICCLFSGNLYFCFDYSLSNFMFPASLLAVFELLCGEVFEAFVIPSAILSPIKSPFVSVVFWISLFQVVLSASVVDFLALSKSFWLCLPLKFYQCFQEKQKPIVFYIYSIFGFNWITHLYNSYIT